MAIDINAIIIVTLRTKPIKYRDPVDGSVQDGLEINPLAHVRFNDGTDALVTYLPRPGDLAQGFQGIDVTEQAAIIFKLEADGPAFDGSNPPNDKRSSSV